MRMTLLAAAFFLLGHGGMAEEPAPPPANGDAAATLAPAAPKPHSRTIPNIMTRPSSLDIVSEPGGRKTLTIHYRWPLHEKTSIEIRLVPTADKKNEQKNGEEKKDADDKLEDAMPIYFHEQFTPQVQEQLFKLLDHSDQGSGLTHTFTKDKIVYKMIGQRNTLGHQAVHVQVYPEKAAPTAKPAMVFLQLDTWAINPQMLSLEMPRDEFPKSGKLSVWFFRGDKVLWEEKLDWPGYGK